MGCAGTLPQSYANVSSMKELILSNNRFNGRSVSFTLQMPLATCSAQDLMHDFNPVQCFSTALSSVHQSRPHTQLCAQTGGCCCRAGPLPDAWGGLSNLTGLTLMGNNLTGRAQALVHQVTCLALYAIRILG